jgi:heme a synthase
MNGHVVPPEILYLRPWYANFFDNMATIQFVHRSLAWMLAVLTPWFWWRVIRGVADARARLAAHALLAMLAIQIALGIATLVLLVPVPLAAAHQAGAVMLLAAAINAAHSLRS